MFVSKGDREQTKNEICNEKEERKNYLSAVKRCQRSGEKVV